MQQVKLFKGIESEISQLEAEINEVGGTAQLVSDIAAARKALCELLDDHRPESALCWTHPLVEQLELPAMLGERSIALWNHAQLSELDATARRKTVLEAGIGISSVDLAIAETGTLLVASAPGHERVTSLVPPIHVAVIGRHQIVPDLIDAIGQLQEQGIDDLSSSVVLITGPSKSGDIELQLTTGVHGPGTWHVIVIQDAGDLGK